MLLLCPALCWAQRGDVTHNFHTDCAEAVKRLTFSNGYTKGYTSLLTYACSNGAVFGTFHVGGGIYEVCLNLTSTNHVVTTSAVDSLAGIDISFYPSSVSAPNIQLQLSRDSVHWSNPIVSDGMYKKGSIKATFTPGRYYVRLTNTDSPSTRSVSIYQITYSFGACNCFLYIPEE